MIYSSRLIFPNNEAIQIQTYSSPTSSGRDLFRGDYHVDRPKLPSDPILRPIDQPPIVITPLSVSIARSDNKRNPTRQTCYLGQIHRLRTKLTLMHHN